MEERFETFTVLITKISRNIREIKNQEMAADGLDTIGKRYDEISKEPIHVDIQTMGMPHLSDGVPWGVALSSLPRAEGVILLLGAWRFLSEGTIRFRSRRNRCGNREKPIDGFSGRSVDKNIRLPIRSMIRHSPILRSTTQKKHWCCIIKISVILPLPSEAVRPWIAPRRWGHGGISSQDRGTDGRYLRVLHRLPTLIAIPTTARTGSGTTLAAVITDRETHHKYAFDEQPT